METLDSKPGSIYSFSLKSNRPGEVRKTLGENQPVLHISRLYRRPNIVFIETLKSGSSSVLKPVTLTSDVKQRKKEVNIIDLTLTIATKQR